RCAGLEFFGPAIFRRLIRARLDHAPFVQLSHLQCCCSAPARFSGRPAAEFGSDRARAARSFRAPFITLVLGQSDLLFNINTCDTMAPFWRPGRAGDSWHATNRLLANALKRSIALAKFNFRPSAR